MTIEEKRRQVFEAWYKKEFPAVEVRAQNLLGTYTRQQVELSWIGFNAALDAVVIDIRKDYFPGSDNMGAIVLDKNYSRFAFLRIIEDTGLGIKVKS